MPPSETTQGTTKTGSSAGPPASATTRSPGLPGGAAPMTPGPDEPVPVDREHTYTASEGRSGSPGGVGEQAGKARDSARDAAREAKHRTAEQVRETYDEVRGFTNEALEKARSQMGETGQQARQKLQEMAQDGKGRTAGIFDDLSKAARAAVDTLEERNDHRIASYARTAANSLEQVRDYVRHADLSDLADDAGRVTRQHPGMVLGGLFVAGLAVSRFLKADRPYASRHRPPHGADESLYRDIAEQQESHHAAFGGEDSLRSTPPYPAGARPTAGTATTGSAAAKVGPASSETSSGTPGTSSAAAKPSVPPAAPATPIGSDDLSDQPEPDALLGEATPDTLKGGV